MAKMKKSELWLRTTCIASHKRSNVIIKNLGIEKYIFFDLTNLID